jgi:hypothetical protein
MAPASRSHLATIGRRGGIRSRRTLAADVAREMLRAREAQRAVRRFAASALAAPAVPGSDLIATGLRDLAAKDESDAALLVSIAAPQLEVLAVRVPRVLSDPEMRLYGCLAERYGDGAHSRHHALIRRIVSFQRAAPPVLRAAHA